MGDEIEKNLEARLNNVIEEATSTKLPLPAKIAGLDLFTKFQKLKELLQPTTTTTATPPSTTVKLSQEKFYNLNNLLIEWHMQSKNVISTFKFASNLDQINLQDKNNDVASNRIQQREIQGSVDGNTNMGSSNDEFSQQSTNELISLDSKTKAFWWSDRSVDETKVHGLDDKVKSLRRLFVPNNDDYGFTVIGKKKGMRRKVIDGG